MARRRLDDTSAPQPHTAPTANCDDEEVTALRNAVIGEFGDLSVKYLKLYRQLWHKYADDNGTTSKLDELLDSGTADDGTATATTSVLAHIVEAHLGGVKDSKVRIHVHGIAHGPWRLGILTTWAIFGCTATNTGWPSSRTLGSLREYSEADPDFSRAMGRLNAARCSRVNRKQEAVKKRKGKRRFATKEWEPEDIRLAVQAWVDEDAVARNVSMVTKRPSTKGTPKSRSVSRAANKANTVEHGHESVMDAQPGQLTDVDRNRSSSRRRGQDDEVCRPSGESEDQRRQDRSTHGERNEDEASDGGFNGQDEDNNGYGGGPNDCGEHHGHGGSDDFNNNGYDDSYFPDASGLNPSFSIEQGRRAVSPGADLFTTAADLTTSAEPSRCDSGFGAPRLFLTSTPTKQQQQQQQPQQQRFHHRRAVLGFTPDSPTRCRTPITPITPITPTPSPLDMSTRAAPESAASTPAKRQRTEPLDQFQPAGKLAPAQRMQCWLDVWVVSPASATTTPSALQCVVDKHKNIIEAAAIGIGPALYIVLAGDSHKEHGDQGDADEADGREDEDNTRGLLVIWPNATYIWGSSRTSSSVHLEKQYRQIYPDIERFLPQPQTEHSPEFPKLRCSGEEVSLSATIAATIALLVSCRRPFEIEDSGALDPLDAAADWSRYFHLCAALFANPDAMTPFLDINTYEAPSPSTRPIPTGSEADLSEFYTSRLDVWTLQRTYLRTRAALATRIHDSLSRIAKSATRPEARETPHEIMKVETRIQLSRELLPECTSSEQEHLHRAIAEMEQTAERLRSQHATLNKKHLCISRVRTALVYSLATTKASYEREATHLDRTISAAKQDWLVAAQARVVSAQKCLRLAEAYNAQSMPE